MISSEFEGDGLESDSIDNGSVLKSRNIPSPSQSLLQYCSTPEICRYSHFFINEHNSIEYYIIIERQDDIFYLQVIPYFRYMISKGYKPDLNAFLAQSR